MAVFDLVFEGGGAKGVAFLGALEELDALGHTVRRVIGTSAGAITAVLVAARFPLHEIREMVLERDHDGVPRFTSFLETPQRWEFSDKQIEASQFMEALARVDIPMVPEWAEKHVDQVLIDRLMDGRLFPRLFSFVERGGAFSDNNFLQWMQEKLLTRGIRPEDTLSTFAQQGRLDMSVVAADATDGQTLILNHRTAPDLPVCWAVRMSMSIPFIWPEVIWRPQWGQYRGRDVAGHAIVDGGTLSNFPIRFVATLDDEVAAIMGNTDPEGAGNLGMMIDEASPVPGQPDVFPRPGFLAGFRTAQRVTKILDMMMGAHDKEMIHRFEQFIVRLPAKGYGTLEFDLKDKRLDDFVNAARLAVRKHFAKLEQ